jgi:hypothetical protein
VKGEARIVIRNRDEELSKFSAYGMRTLNCVVRFNTFEARCALQVEFCFLTLQTAR